MFEISRLSSARQLGQPMHSQSANFRKFKFNSLNLVGVISHDSVQLQFYYLSPPLHQQYRWLCKHDQTSLANRLFFNNSALLNMAGLSAEAKQGPFPDSGQLIIQLLYSAGRPIIRKVSKIRIWVVPPVCLGSR